MKGLLSNFGGLSSGKAVIEGSSCTGELRVSGGASAGRGGRMPFGNEDDDEGMCTDSDTDEGAISTSAAVCVTGASVGWAGGSWNGRRLEGGSPGCDCEDSGGGGIEEVLACIGADAVIGIGS